MKKKEKSTSAMSHKYEAAWHKLFYALPRWKQESIVEEPHGRHADELAHEAAILAETTLPNVVPSGSSHY